MSANRRFSPLRAVGLSALAQVISLLDRVQDRIATAFDRLDSEFVPTAATSLASLTTSDGRVYHGLGRQVRGWLVVRNSTNAVIYEGTASAEPTQYLNFRASASASVTLLFF